MGAPIWIYLWLVWSLVGDCAPPTATEKSLGEKVFIEQKKCESFIADELDAILDDEESDLHDIPAPNQSYIDCKKEVNKLKREFIQTMKVREGKEFPKADFLTIRLTEGTIEVPYPPTVEEEEDDDLDFNINEEVCVTKQKCQSLSELVQKGEEPKLKQDHCDVLLKDITSKYIEEKIRDVEKLKADRGVTVKCHGKPVLLDIPKYEEGDLYNHLYDHHISEVSPLDFGEDKEHTHKEKKHPAHQEEHPSDDGKLDKPAKETPTEVKASPSSGFVTEAKLFSFGLVVLVLAM